MTTDELLLILLQEADPELGEELLIDCLSWGARCSWSYAEAWYRTWKASQEAQGDIEPECMGYSIGYAGWLDDGASTPVDEDEEMDAINPSHYRQGNVECIDAICDALGDEQYKGYLRGNVMKYLWRLEHKGCPLENAQKARWYLDRLINDLEIEKECE